MNLSIYQVDAKVLGSTLAGASRQKGNKVHFDRIDKSNIVDHGYLGLNATFLAFRPMLKKKLDNKHATMLTNLMFCDP